LIGLKSFRSLGSENDKTNVSDVPKELENKDVNLSSIGLKAQELIQLALKGTLSVTHQQTLMAYLNEDENVVYQIGITPKQV
jgi:hypothetical protein